MYEGDTTAISFPFDNHLGLINTLTQLEFVQSSPCTPLAPRVHLPPQGAAIEYSTFRTRELQVNFVNARLIGHYETDSSVGQGLRVRDGVTNQWGKLSHWCLVIYMYGTFDSCRDSCRRQDSDRYPSVSKYLTNFPSLLSRGLARVFH